MITDVDIEKESSFFADINKNIKINDINKTTVDTVNSVLIKLMLGIFILKSLCIYVANNIIDKNNITVRAIMGWFSINDIIFLHILNSINDIHDLSYFHYGALKNSVVQQIG